MLRPFVKDIVFQSYAGVRSAWRRSTRPGTQISILLYHRVNDELRDSVTVGIQQFDEQMKWVSRHYDVCTIDDVINGVVRSSKRPVVSVTFDDGYLDNYTNAAPILRSHRVPCAFFVSTGIVGTSRAFPHDLEKLGRRVPAMTWDHVQELHAQGFTIGSHTVSHINLATASDEEALQELTESRNTLVKVLGLNRVAIAYPFGKRTDISSPRIAMIRDTGYSACFSGYGGVNWKESLDVYDLKRTNVDYRFTISALRARIDGWSSG
jgi:peptidoglycan/xylan/chitin deacetylase (PgdA/CDA1 family)